MQQLLNHIHTHFDETITLDSLAALISVSPSEVLRCFKAVIGLSPIRYVKNYRLHSAAHLLSDTDYPIRTVYEMCGFDDSSYFLSLLRKSMVSPHASTVRSSNAQLADPSLAV